MPLTITYEKQHQVRFLTKGKIDRQLHVAHAEGSVLAIITLATPHQQAPANVHQPLHAFYHNLQKAAGAAQQVLPYVDETQPHDWPRVPLLSIAGGDCE